MCLTFLNFEKCNAFLLIRSADHRINDKFRRTRRDTRRDRILEASHRCTKKKKHTKLSPPVILSLSHHTLICSCLQDYADTELLLSRANVDQAALLSYACEAADFSTNRRLPALDFAINHYGLPDVAMFDFTCMYASENAALVRQRHGHKLLVALVGDSLLEVSVGGGRRSTCWEMREGLEG